MREKLIELIGQVQDCGCDVTDVVEMNYVENNVLVDHLIANCVTIQRWIPVEERLPEDGVCCDVKQIKVLVVLESSNGVRTVRSQTRYRDIWGKEIRWMWKQSYGKVTHWMPLPEAPEGE